MQLLRQAAIELDSELKREKIRTERLEASDLAVSVPQAIVDTTQLLDPHLLSIFSANKPTNFALHGMAASGDAKSSTKEIKTNIVRSTHKGNFTSFSDDSKRK